MLIPPANRPGEAEEAAAVKEEGIYIFKLEGTETRLPLPLLSELFVLASYVQECVCHPLACIQPGVLLLRSRPPYPLPTRSISQVARLSILTPPRLEISITKLGEGCVSPGRATATSSVPCVILGLDRT